MSTSLYWLLPLTGVVGHMAAHHLWLWTGRRTGPLHLWAAGCCAGTLLYLVGRSAQVAAGGADGAVLAARVVWTGALLLAVLSVGVCHALARQPLPRRRLAVLVIVTGAMLLAVWFTEALVTTRAYERVDVLGILETVPVPRPMVPLVIPYVVLLFLYCFRLLYRAHDLDGRERRAMLWGIGAYVAFAVNDALVAARVIRSVRLFDVAFVGIAVGLTYVLVRRHNRLYARLNEEVAAQTHALREQHEQLAVTQERYALLFERNLAGVLWTDGRGRIVDCNEALARLLGYDSRQELLKHNVSEFYVDPGDRAAVLADLQFGMATGRELRWRRRDGSTVWLRVNLRAADHGLFEGIHIDVSNEKRLAQAEREATELRAIAGLATAAAHEINTPLTVLVGQVVMLQGEVPANARFAKILRSAERIGDAVQRMARITRIEMFQHSESNLPPMINIDKSSEQGTTGSP